MAPLPSTRRPWSVCPDARAWAVLCLAWCFTAPLGVCPARGAPPVRAAEYQLKAAFLYNFTKFVGWPESAFPAKDSPLVIGVCDPSVFGPELEAIGRKQIQGRPVRVVHCVSATQAGACHILFVNCPDPGKLRSHLALVHGKPVLTVGETDDFHELGGAVTFYLSGKKLRFEINADACSRAGLTVSSKLLRLARAREHGDRE